MGRRLETKAVDGILDDRQARFSEKLRSLVCTERDGPRVYLGSLASELSKHDHANHDPKLRGYLKGTSRPRLPAAYSLGNALNSLGITWMSGFVMLHSAGRLSDMVGILSAYCANLEIFKPDLSMFALWRLFVLSSSLAEAVPLDQDARIIELSTSDAAEILERVELYQKIEAETYSHTPLDRQQADHRIAYFDRFLRRETAKIELLKISPHLDMGRLDQAYGQWIKMRGKISPWGLGGAYYLAEAPNLPFLEVDLAVRHLVNDYFEFFGYVGSKQIGEPFLWDAGSFRMDMDVKKQLWKFKMELEAAFSAEDCRQHIMGVRPLICTYCGV